MRREIKFLMGATNDNSLVFCELGFYERENGDELAISFNEVAPVVASESYLEMMFESIKDCYDDSGILDLCRSYNCTPDEVFDNLYNDIRQNIGVEGFIDISLFSDSFTVPSQEDDIYFESVGCGQCDTRDTLIPINKTLSDLIFDSWDKFHLKKVSSGLKNDLINAVNLAKIDETAWIQNWLETEIYPA
jgi:hypothetical protein